MAAVVVSWNSEAQLEGCLASVQAQRPAEIVVVDNGSADRSCDIARRTPGVELIALSENSGFAAASNLGAQRTSSPYVLFLNDDARLEPGYLQVLLAALEAQPRAASAVGKLVTDRDGRRWVDSAGIRLRRYALAPLDRGHGELDRGQYDTPCEIFGPSAAAALYRRKALEAVGPDYFDEDLFAYYEDVDLAWRLRRAGWTALYEPRAVAQHLRRGPQSKTSTVAGRAFTNRYLVWLKNESPLRFAAYAPLALSWEAVRLLRRAVVAPGLVAAVPAGLRRMPQVWRKRRLARRQR